MMGNFSTEYKGYTITELNGRWHIATITYVDFTTLDAAKKYIDKI
jgi:hypothetical protein